MSKLITTSQITLMNLTERAETRRETFYKLTNSADAPEHPEGNRNLYALSKNSRIYTGGVSEFVQNVETGEISWKTASVSDSQFGGFISTIGTAYRGVFGIKIPVVQNKDILVSLTDDRLIKNYAMFWGEDGTLVKKTIKYTTNRFKIPASLLEGVSFLTFRFGVKENTQEIGTLIKTKVKIEYGNVYTDWTPAPEDLGWSMATLVPTQQQRYLWKFDYIYYSDDSVEITPPVNLSLAGKDGVGVKSHLVTYGLSASETAQPTSWSTQVPTLTKGNYLWTKTTWTYTDNTTETGYQKTYIAKDGNNGKDGIAGKDGVGIKSTAFFYVGSTSGTTKPTTGWSTTIPVVSPGNYLWTKTVWTYTDSTSETGYSVSKMGESQYTHYAYCNITKLCNESDSFTLKDKSTVRYGRDDKWVYKTLEAGTYVAKNSLFGRDPAPSLTKACYLISNFSLTDSTNCNWLGMYSDNLSDAVANPSYFTWQLTRGDTGPQGIQGPKGDQGIQGPKGDGGKTSYLHLAFASSADGKTGFSFTDTKQQYQGYYTDFTQTSSTDPTKYTWMDRRAGIEVSTRNLWIQSKATGGFVEEELADNHITGQKKCYRINSGKEMRFIIEPNFSSRLYQKVTFSAWIKYENVVQGTHNWNRFNVFKHNFTYHSSETDKDSDIDYTALATYDGTADWQYVHFTFDYSSARTGYDELKGSLVFNLEGTKSGIAWVTGVMVQFGNVATGHVWAPEDVQSDIDNKADQAITQQQLEALEAKRQQMIVEIEAKATLEQVSELTTLLNNLKKEDTDGRQKIVEITNAIEERVKNIEPIMDYSQKMQFIDTYITQGNGGMIIGANDSTTKVVVTPNRISFQDGGSEVAYISQSVLHIDNGVFTMSLQLGHFITRAHPKNQYVNATYFVK